MTGYIVLDDLKRIVADLNSGRFRPHLAEEDAPRIARVIHCIAVTLEETKVKVDPNEHLLRASEASALAGFLRSRYSAIAKRRHAARKRDASRAAVDARNDLTMSGVRVTEAAVAASAAMDETHQNFVEAEITSQELADHFDSLYWALRNRLDVLTEISWNERAILKGSKE